MPQGATGFSSQNDTTSSSEGDDDEITVAADDDEIADDGLSASADVRKQRRKEAVILMDLLHKYARENLLLANIYIKDPAVTLIKRDQKVTIKISL